MIAPGPVLVIAAHPDDEVLGCGGTIARLAAEGREVSIAILGEGLTARDPQRDTTARAAALVKLRSDADQAARTLGARQLFTFDFPDNRLDTVPRLDVIKRIEELIDRLRPAVVFTQHGGDLNVDHQLLFEAVLTATRPVCTDAQRTIVAQVLAYEVASSTEWAFQRISPVFRPNLFIDIAATLELKLAAMRCYEAESRPFPHPRSPEALRAQALRWGATAGLPAAEAFEQIRSVL